MSTNQEIICRFQYAVKGDQKCICLLLIKEYEFSFLFIQFSLKYSSFKVLQLRRDDSFQPDVFMNELDNYNNNFQIGPIFGFGPVKRPGGGILHNRGFEPFFPYWVILLKN